MFDMFLETRPVTKDEGRALIDDYWGEEAA